MSKQVICSVLAAKFYRMAYEFNIKVILKAMLEKMLRSAILLVSYINLKSLYKCLVK